MSLSTDLSTVSLVSPLPLCLHEGFMGWWKDLRDETEFMPNSHFRELDFIEEKDLFGEEAQRCTRPCAYSASHTPFRLPGRVPALDLSLTTEATTAGRGAGTTL